TCHQRDALHQGSRCESGENLFAGSSTELRQVRVEDDSAADREGRRVASNDKTVARDSNDRSFQPDLRIRRLSIAQGSVGLIHEADGAQQLGGKVMEANPRLLFEWLRVA